MRERIKLVALVLASVMGFVASAEAADPERECTVGIARVNELVKAVPAANPTRLEVQQLSLKASNASEQARYAECLELTKIAVNRLNKS